VTDGAPGRGRGGRPESGSSGRALSFGRGAPPELASFERLHRDAEFLCDRGNVSPLAITYSGGAGRRSRFGDCGGGAAGGRIGFRRRRIGRLHAGGGIGFSLSGFGFRGFPAALHEQGHQPTTWIDRIKNTASALGRRFLFFCSRMEPCGQVDLGLFIEFLRQASFL